MSNTKLHMYNGRNGIGNTMLELLRLNPIKISITLHDYTDPYIPKHDKDNVIFSVVTRTLFSIEQIEEVCKKTGIKCHGICYEEDRSTELRSGTVIYFNYKSEYKNKTY